MSVLVKIYAHNGWRYYQPLGIINAHNGSPSATAPSPVANLPFTAAQYDAGTTWTDAVNGRNYLNVGDNQAMGLYKIKDNPDALVLRSYRTDSGVPLNLPISSTSSKLFGNALTLRIKIGQFTDASMMLCVLYGAKGRQNEKLIIAVENSQIVTYYFKLNDEENNVEKTDTNIFINGDDQWVSIGFNFHSGDRAGLAGIFVNGQYTELNISPLVHLNNFWLFGVNQDESPICQNKVIYPFNGAISDVKVFENPLRDDEFGSVLGGYDDTADMGAPLTVFETGGELMQMFINVKKSDVNAPSIGDGGSSGSGNTGNINDATNGGQSGKQDPLG